VKEQTKKILDILTYEDKIKVIYSVLILILKTILEVLSLGILIPILNFVTNSNSDNFFYSNFNFLKNYDSNRIIIFLVSFFVIVYFAKTIFIIFSNNWNARFINNLSSKLTYRSTLKYLEKDYIFFVENNPAFLIRNISSETGIFATLIANIITCISQLFFIISICLFLIFFNIYSLYVILILLFLSLIIINFSNKKFKKWGIIRQEQSAYFSKKIIEIIGNIKEIILYNKKIFFSNEVYLHSKKYADSNIYRDTAISFASPALEFFGILVFFLFLLFLILYSNQSLSEIVVLFGIFVFATLKLLPAVVSFVRSFQSIKFNLSACDVLYDILREPKCNGELKLNSKDEQFINIESLEFINVDFKYNISKTLNLKNINFKISKGDKVAIIGETGSGKTTLLNLISNLTIPTSGDIKINNKKILNFSNEVRKHIGYVSQFVYLSDNSIVFNIALSNDVSIEQKKKIITILENLNLNFINGKPIDIYSPLGEKGSKLSGGQIQRLGIARALYRNPDILILDESTNALDDENEKKIFNFLFKEFKEKIIVFCSHKKEVQNYCNKILEVKNSTVKIK